MNVLRTAENAGCEEMGMVVSKSSNILEVRDLHTHFYSPEGIVKAVDGITFHVESGEVLGLVGESGSGKSVSALSILRLVPDPPGKIVSGEVYFQGRDLLRIPVSEMRKIRGPGIGIIFQEPMTSLTPVLSIGRQLRESLELHFSMTKRQALSRAQELLEMVGIPDGASRLNAYPHQLSGGQRQRVMIAIAFSCQPELLIADEATTALDVTIQSQILELIVDLTEQFGTSVIMITHNLGVVARYADRVGVMYAGKIREMGSGIDIFHRTKHPYTAGLLNSVPRLDMPIDQHLMPIRGDIPNLQKLPPGCAFQDRCDLVTAKCNENDPLLTEAGSDHESACWEPERVTPISQGAVR